ncbi:unnamed protein product [Blepharisma stoltei]|uniref:Uncharacterized protein n=1 Tax=Blepharisma stoltei TaxID=1481888 RepID=A0AAU9JC33_9CILI|nr:unnamed protein product [Blepharisma stoltei]
MKQPEQLILTPGFVPMSPANEAKQLEVKSPATILRKKYKKLSQKIMFPPKTPHNTTQYLIKVKPSILSDTQPLLGTMHSFNLDLILK